MDPIGKRGKLLFYVMTCVPHGFIICAGLSKVAFKIVSQSKDPFRCPQ